MLFGVVPALHWYVPLFFPNEVMRLLLRNYSAIVFRCVRQAHCDIVRFYAPA
jgi:hypothetical protein